MSEQSSAPPSPPPPRRVSLEKPTRKRTPSKPPKMLRQFRSVLRSLPIITFTPHCKLPAALNQTRIQDGRVPGATRMTGTLFGHKKARVNLAFQENPRSIPSLLLELAIPTGKLLQDMDMGLVRIVFECEKKPGERTKIIDEPIWTLYCNGKKSGYGVKRDPSDEDLNVMQKLHAMSIGAGVLPGETTREDRDHGELAYVRGHFDRVIGSRDSETYYLVNPEGNDGPELTIFFVRI